MTLKGLIKTVRLLLEFRSIEIEIQSEISSIESSLKAAMLIKKTDILTGKHFAVVLKASVTIRFNANVFRLTHADLHGKSVTVRKLVISKNNG